MKKIPYGISNFQTIREQNYLYIDKTKYIEILENEPPYQFFIRPRKFGKSLFLSMLENYYDINKSHKFQELFQNLYIGESPTEKRNSYLIFYINFSNLVVSNGKERFVESFDQCVLSAAKEFLNKYDKYLRKEDILGDSVGAEIVVNKIIALTNNSNQKMFIIIDEYDNFANDLISCGNKNLYYDVISSEGYVRTFYKTIKTGTAFCVDRIFITGVSPIMLDDLTSGFNVTINLTLENNLNEMLGFNEDEVKNILKEFEIEKNFDLETVLKDMQQYYNGYLFSKNGENRVYNPNLTLYFIQSIIKNKVYPENILDLNIKTDYKKLENMAFNFKDEETVKQLISEEIINTKLVEKFNLEYMYDKKENFISLLYYMGMLTIESTYFDKCIMKIPNYSVKTVYWEYFIEKIYEKMNVTLEDVQLLDSVHYMASKGEVSFLIDYLRKFISILSNRDLMQFNEKNVKMILISLFINGIYLVNSEFEVEEGYVDIFLSANKAYDKYINYEWIIELKYVKESDKNKIEDVKKQGVEQLKRYRSSSRLRNISHKEKKYLLIVVEGKKNVEYVEVY
ncbi:PD-(D/E)XK nuclease superfamily protein [Hathewaya proteolytica DSM 3090]|uniref:PD-(D/E)XK nuclease superfamily protein n=1 Tax=Hathewaya proteolytica DSM 3090 TaxID=1121331 RepID=A0A1M6QZ64_9CLOT|nr:AAA family ATPase [Hathewaya proteolytica]SHK25446.1 PD-(D/E)XK nuclease superfamily protein [Hathewaya proteolytica DSM 3090]